MEVKITTTNTAEFQVTARKWRPMFFDDVVGQEHITTTLKNAIETGRIAHAYLFTGSRGVGKTSTARILARALNCVNGPTINPCGTCHICQDIIHGNSMDVIEIDGASNRRIEEIRELRDSIKFVPSEAKYKTYIIDEVHMLTREAFNALLKTLEEPPAHAIFIFATTEPHKLPLTIISRCQRFDFHRIGQTKLAEKLKKIADAEGVKAEDGVFEAIGRAGDGSMRDAQSMLDQVIAFCGNTITFKQISEILGLYNKELFFKLCDFAYKKQVADGIILLDKIVRDGKNLTQFMDEWLTHYRYLLLVKILNDKTDVLDCTPEEVEKIRKQAKLYTTAELEFAVEIISETANKMRYALSIQVLIELLFMKLSRLKSVISVENALLKLEEIQQKGISVNKVSVKPEPRKEAQSVGLPIQNDLSDEQSLTDSEGKSPDKIVVSQKEPVSDQNTESPPVVRPDYGEIDFDKIKESWDAICDSCSNHSLSSCLRKVSFDKFEDKTLVLGVEEDWFLSHLSDKVKEIEKTISVFFNTDVAVHLKKNDKSLNSEDRGNNSAEKGENKSTNSKEDEILHGAEVRMMIDTFNAKIVNTGRKK